MKREDGVYELTESGPTVEVYVVMRLEWKWLSLRGWQGINPGVITSSPES